MFDTLPGFLTFIAVLCGLLAAFCLRARSWKISCGTGAGVFVLLFVICRGMGGILAPMILMFLSWPTFAVCAIVGLVQLVRVARRRHLSRLPSPGTAQ